MFTNTNDDLSDNIRYIENRSRLNFPEKAMRTLLQSLQDFDLGHLRIIAEFWGFDLPSESSRALAEWLSVAMLEKEAILELTDGLPEKARQALEDIFRQGGKVPYSDMMPQYGEIREMGEGRRDRTKPWRNPISPLEILWYRGLIARAFSDTVSGPREFIFIPSDLLQHLPSPISARNDIPGEEVDSPEHIQSAVTSVVEDATTILAFLRREPIKSDNLQSMRRDALIPFLRHPQSLDLISTLLMDCGLLTSQPIQPQIEATRTFLEAPKEKASARLLLTWRDSINWNDLMHVGGIQFKGEKWPNDPLTSRHAVLNFLSPIPVDRWWGQDSFIQSIFQHHPGFLRPGGDFDSWYLQDSETGIFMRGFEHWKRIDGALIRYIITNPMAFLGAIDLGTRKPGQPITSFRLTPISRCLFNADFQVEQQSTTPISIFLNGTILAPFSSLQSHRYQIARFCDWMDLSPSGYRYRISPSALERASEQGLTINHIKSILEQVSEKSLPASLFKALSRWESKGLEAYVEKTLLLRLKEPQMLERLQSNQATARFLQERIGPTSIVVREKDLEKLYSAAARLGILIDAIKGNS